MVIIGSCIMNGLPNFQLQGELVVNSVLFTRRNNKIWEFLQLSSMMRSSHWLLWLGNQWHHTQVLRLIVHYYDPINTRHRVGNTWHAQILCVSTIKYFLCNSTSSHIMRGLLNNYGGWDLSPFFCTKSVQVGFNEAEVSHQAFSTANRYGSGVKITW